MEIKGDFLGFEFAGVRSEELGIIRVSNGDRYEEELQPEVKDMSAEVPGVDGEYYFGSAYGTKSISIEIAFDGVTEEQFRRISRVFGRKSQGDLIFDERPYKKYIAKIESPVELSYVCFDEPMTTIGESRNGVRRNGTKEETIVHTVEDSITIPAEGIVEYTLEHEPFGEVIISGTNNYTVDGNTYIFNNSLSSSILVTIIYEYVETVIIPKWEQVTPIIRDYTKTQRIYKGEGTINFICYFPFAKSTLKQIPFNYEITQDTEIVEGKKYFEQVSENVFEWVEEPVIEDISTYYERVNDKEVEKWASFGGILSVDKYENFDVYKDLNGTDYGFNIYNAGDLDTGFRMYCPFSDGISYNLLKLSYINMVGDEPIELQLENIESLGEDIGFIIDTNSGLIFGVDSFSLDSNGNCFYTTTNNLYNKFIVSGEMFKLQPNVTSSDGSKIVVTGGNEDMQIFYDYLYF